MSDLYIRPEKNAGAFQHVSAELGMDVRRLYDRATRAAEWARHCGRKYSREVAEAGLIRVAAADMKKLLDSEDLIIAELDGWDIKAVWNEIRGGSGYIMVPAQLVVCCINLLVSTLVDMPPYGVPRWMATLASATAAAEEMEKIKGEIGGEIVDIWKDLHARAEKTAVRRDGPVVEVGQLWKDIRSSMLYIVSEVIEERHGVEAGVRYISKHGRHRHTSLKRFVDTHLQVSDVKVVTYSVSVGEASGLLVGHIEFAGSCGENSYTWDVGYAALRYFIPLAEKVIGRCILPRADKSETPSTEIEVKEGQLWRTKTTNFNIFAIVSEVRDGWCVCCHTSDGGYYQKSTTALKRDFHLLSDVTLVRLDKSADDPKKVNWVKLTAWWDGRTHHDVTLCAIGSFSELLDKYYFNKSKMVRKNGNNDEYYEATLRHHQLHRPGMTKW